MAREIRGPFDAAEMQRFRDSFMYRDEAFLVDEILRMDPEQRGIEALLDTTRPYPSPTASVSRQSIRPTSPAPS